MGGALFKRAQGEGAIRKWQAVHLRKGAAADHPKAALSFAPA
jgi:hypothetical protein